VIAPADSYADGWGAASVRDPAPVAGPSDGQRFPASSSNIALAILGIGDASASDATRFRALWDKYPSTNTPYVDKDTGRPPKGFEDQCAIKVGIAMQGAGYDISTFSGATVRVDGAQVPIRAEEFSNWLDKARIDGMGKVEVITGADWEKKIEGRTGIVSFKDYWLRPGEKTPTGDHIDLWNGSRLTATGVAGTIQTYLRYFGVREIDGLYSDLSKSKVIRFYPLK
jgi:hypothetical protein